MKVKLICPLCEKQFITNRHSQIYCTKDCTKRHKKIKMQCTENRQKQQRARMDYILYELETDKMYIIPKPLRK